MKAFILGAGFGTRLRPLTNHTPKPLIPVFGIPLIDLTIHRLKEHGIKEIVINNHHLGAKIMEYLGDGTNHGVGITHSPEKNILGSGGAIGAAADYLRGGDFFLLHNGDTISDIDLSLVMASHCSSGNNITMVLIDREEYNQVAVDLNGVVLDISRKREEEGQKNIRYLAYTGISIINTDLLPAFPCDRPEDLIKILLSFIQKGLKVKYFFAGNPFWEDVGNLQSYFGLHRSLSAQGRSPYKAPSARVAPSAKLKGFYSLGDQVVIGENCLIENSIIMAGSVLKDGCSVSNGIFDGAKMIYKDKP